MLQEIWEPELTAVFVGLAVDEVSDTLGFYHLNPGNRFWELLELGGITPERHITSSERKALTEGHTRGNLSDPIRAMFIQKKTSQLLRCGVGITTMNQRVIAKNDKEKAARRRLLFFLVWRRVCEGRVQASIVNPLYPLCWRHPCAVIPKPCRPAGGTEHQACAHGNQ